MRKCHICGIDVEDKKECPTCVANFESRRPAIVMTGEERMAEMKSFDGPLEIDFDKMHKRIEELVGRPVFTHELGLNWDGLVQEAGNRQHPSMQEVAELIPEEKRIIIELEGDSK